MPVLFFAAAALRLVLLNIIERGVVDLVLPSILERGLLKDRRSRSSASSGIKPFGLSSGAFRKISYYRVRNLLHRSCHYRTLKYVRIQHG